MRHLQILLLNLTQLEQLFAWCTSASVYGATTLTAFNEAVTTAAILDTGVVKTQERCLAVRLG